MLACEIHSPSVRYDNKGLVVIRNFLCWWWDTLTTLGMTIMGVRYDNKGFVFFLDCRCIHLVTDNGWDGVTYAGGIYWLLLLVGCVGYWCWCIHIKKPKPFLGIKGNLTTSPILSISVVVTLAFLFTSFCNLHQDLCFGLLFVHCGLWFSLSLVLAAASSVILCRPFFQW